MIDMSKTETTQKEEFDHNAAVERAKLIDAKAWAGPEDEMRDRRVMSIAAALREQGWQP